MSHDVKRSLAQFSLGQDSECSKALSKCVEEAWNVRALVVGQQPTTHGSPVNSEQLRHRNRTLEKESLRALTSSRLSVLGSSRDCQTHCRMNVEAEPDATWQARTYELTRKPLSALELDTHFRA
eukprot:1120923-Pleurochrysis_carterae.AAC.4